MKLLLLPFIVLFSACGSDPATGPHVSESPQTADGADRLDGQALFKYGEVMLRSLDGEKIPVPEVAYWLFDEGEFTYTREILVEHPGTNVPESQFITRWERGNYWADDCHERSCTYVFEEIEGQYFSLQSQQMVDIDRDVLTAQVLFGDDRVKIGSVLFERATLGDEPGIRSGAFKK